MKIFFDIRVGCVHVTLSRFSRLNKSRSLWDRAENPRMLCEVSRGHRCGAPRRCTHTRTPSDRKTINPIWFSAHQFVTQPTSRSNLPAYTARRIWPIATACSRMPASRNTRIPKAAATDAMICGRAWPRHSSPQLPRLTHYRFAPTFSFFPSLFLPIIRLRNRDSLPSSLRKCSPLLRRWI